LIGAGALRADYHACIVHGDLNAENVLVSSDGRVMCIDYRYTGWGPRVLDYVPLEASLRLSTGSTEGAVEHVARDHRFEAEIWKRAWGDSDAGKAFAEWPFWARVSVRLSRLMREQIPDVSQKEYAAACLLWALRIFRVTSLRFEARLRLLSWMSGLCHVLEGK
jgi:hypothetical protein